jgi:probable HAF family extracellular repeat protein
MKTLLTLLVCSIGYRATAQSQYTITDLGTLPSFNSSDAGGINAPGQIAGWSHNNSGIDHAFVWTSGSGLLDLGTLAFSSSAAIGINAFGQAAGEVYNNSLGPFHAFFWTSDVGLTDIHSGSFSSSEAMGINASAQIVGRLSNPTGPEHAFLWSSGTGMTDLGPMPGMTDSFAMGINDSAPPGITSTGGPFSGRAQGALSIWVGYPDSSMRRLPRSMLPARSSARPAMTRVRSTASSGRPMVR